MEQYYDITKDSYGGYRIGTTDIYCPWDVIDWCRQLLFSSDKTPENYWTNSGENSSINRFAWMSEDSDRYDLEVLSEGGLQELYRAFDEGKPKKIEKNINACLKESISFMDGGNTEEMKETAYHTLLVGMAKGRRGWIVKSEREAGRGRADIIIVNRLRNEGIIIEVKHTDDRKKLQAKSEEVLQQIRDMNYGEYFLGFQTDRIEEYGIAFSGKECRVLRGKLKGGICFTESKDYKRS